MNHQPNDDAAEPTGRVDRVGDDQPPQVDLDQVEPDPAPPAERLEADLRPAQQPYPRYLSRRQVAKLLGMRTTDVGKLLGITDLARSVLAPAMPQLNAIAETTWAAPSTRRSVAALLATPELGKATDVLASRVVQDAAVSLFTPAAPRFATLTDPFAAGLAAADPLRGVMPQFMPAIARARLVAAIAPQMPNLAGVFPAFDLFRRQNQAHLLASVAAMYPLSDAIGQLLETWRSTAGEPGPTTEPAAQAYAAALRVRQTILTDPDPTPAVVEFGRTWLNFSSMPQSRVEATVMALLDDAWIGGLVDGDFSTRLRHQVDRAHEVHRPITERQVRGQSVTSLDQPVVWSIESGPLTLLDFTAAADPTEEVALNRIGGWGDVRIGRVLSSLDDREHAVTMAYVSGGGYMTWALAAAMVGMDEKFATRVQTKLKRAGRKLSQRLEAVQAATR